MSNRNRSSNSNSGGIGFVGALTIAFTVLKLTGHIEWPWIWVVSPVWISVLFMIFGLAAIFVAVFIAHPLLFKARRWWRGRR